MQIGYVRVSTPDQSFTLQRDAPEQSGCTKVLQEVASGAKTARPGQRPCPGSSTCVAPRGLAPVALSSMSLRTLSVGIDETPAMSISKPDMGIAMTRKAGNQMTLFRWVHVTTYQGAEERHEENFSRPVLAQREAERSASQLAWYTTPSARTLGL